MVTGRRAFEGKTKAIVIGAILTAEPPAMRSVQPVTPPALEGVVVLCLGKDPEERYQSVRDVVLDLRAAGNCGSASGSGAEAWVAGCGSGACSRAVAGAAFWGGQRLRPARIEVPDLRFTRLTSDAGLTFEPAISPDGKLLVYASDRAGSPRWNTEPITRASYRLPSGKVSRSSLRIGRS
jgi:hypothetical protein